jgi:hypothetical protein
MLIIETDMDRELRRALSVFGKKLAAEQKPLEPEIQEVLKDNIWELLALRDRGVTDGDEKS